MICAHYFNNNKCTLPSLGRSNRKMHLSYTYKFKNLHEKNSENQLKKPEDHSFLKAEGE